MAFRTRRRTHTRLPIECLCTAGNGCARERNKRYTQYNKYNMCCCIHLGIGNTQTKTTTSLATIDRQTENVATTRLVGRSRVNESLHGKKRLLDRSSHHHMMRLYSLLLAFRPTTDTHTHIKSSTQTYKLAHRNVIVLNAVYE